MHLGRHIYGLAAIALGVVGLSSGLFAAVWQPVPEDLPGRVPLAYATAALFLLAGIALQWRRSARVSAIVAALLFAVFAALWAKRIFGFPALFATWSGFAEQFACVLGGVTAYVLLQPRETAWQPRAILAARILFGLCLLAFGGAHLLYPVQTAEAVPSYMPGGQDLWGKITGAAHIAAGLSLISGILAPLAARLLTAMFVVFGALVWAPQLLHAPVEHMVFAGNAVNLALVGSAWVIADALGWKPAAS